MMTTSNCVDNSTNIGPPELGLTFQNFTISWVVQASCGLASYIRPDDAGSILPWPYTLGWFLVHFPITLIRVHRWERVQALSIILAIVTIYFQLQAYSNGLEPDSVLVWMPIFVVLDIGAMMQLVFLIMEDGGFKRLKEAFLATFHRRGRRDSTSSTLAQEVQDIELLESKTGKLTRLS